MRKAKTKLDVLIDDVRHIGNMHKRHMLVATWFTPIADTGAIISSVLSFVIVNKFFENTLGYEVSPIVILIFSSAAIILSILPVTLKTREYGDKRNQMYTAYHELEVALRLEIIDETEGFRKFQRLNRMERTIWRNINKEIDSLDDTLE